MKTGVDSLSLLQEIFPTQESNQGLLHGRQLLYPRSYQGSLEFWISRCQLVRIGCMEKGLLYSAGNNIQHLATNFKGKQSKRTHTYIK